MTAALCNDARVIEKDESEPELVGDPTEGALLGLAAKAKITPAGLATKYPRLAEVPFDSRRKLMSTIHPAKDGGYLVLVKGAPDVILARPKHLLDSSGRLTAKLADEIRENTKLAGTNLKSAVPAYRKIAAVPPPADLGSVEEILTFLALWD